MSKFKICLIAALLAFSLVGAHISANCSATATGANCNASCSVNNVPAGGSSQCTSAANRADCRGYDAAGNVCCSTGCICQGGGGGFPGTICYIMIGNTCC